MKLFRWTPLMYVAPKLFLSDSTTVENFDVEYWSEFDYEWQEDPWNGYKDFVSEPEATIESGSGDCDDYAAVVASYEYHRDNDVSIAFMYTDGWPLWPEHVVAVTDDRVYSSGEIWHDYTLEEYTETSDYDGYVRRDV